MVTKYFILLLVSISGKSLCSVPVVIWSNGDHQLDYPAPPLKKFSSDEFSSFLSKRLAAKADFIVIFVENLLNLEDFSSRGEDDKSAYPKIEHAITNASSNKFFSYVEKSVDAFKSLAENGYEISNFLEPKSINDLKISKNLFIVKLDDTLNAENRIALLRRHDDQIHQICSEIINKLKNTVCVLTGLRSSWSEPNIISSHRRLLQAAESNPQYPQNFFKLKNWILFYTKQPPQLIDLAKNTTYNVSFNNMVQGTGSTNKQTQTTTINVEADIVSIENPSKKEAIKMKFKFTNDTATQTWHLDNIECFIPYLNKIPTNLSTTFDISGSHYFSYHTPSPVIFSNSEYILTFYSLQIELLSGNDRNAFRAAESTVGFFTIPIWSGLFVTSLLVTIALVGLSLIYDIKTMDQFDDPKGKTVTINASD